MTHTHASPLPHASLSEALRRVLPALLLFALVLLGLLALSWSFVLPKYTSLELNGSLIAAADVPAYARTLEQEIHAAEASRDELTLPLRDPTYTALRQRAREAVSITDVEQLLTSMLSKEEYGANVVIAAIRLDGKAVEIEGDVRDAGPRSMTLLATFVEDLSSQPFISALVPPAFGREEDPVIGIHSPFVIRFDVASAR